MIREMYKWLGVVMLMTFMASCSSTKMAKKAELVDGITEVEYVENVLSSTGGLDVLTAKMSLSIEVGDKQVAKKIGGTLRIKKGEVIQLYVAPFLGIEVARAEISPDGLLVIDRMNKRYVQVSFVELKELANADLDFHTLQALFLNELFLPGKGDLTLRDRSAFKVLAEASGVWLDVKKGKRFNYRFLTQAPEGWLRQSRIGLRGTPYELIWKYDDFRPLENKSFPTDMLVSFDGSNKPVKAAFAFSRLSTKSDWETHTEVSSKYEKVKLEDILKQLLKK